MRGGLFVRGGLGIGRDFPGGGFPGRRIVMRRILGRGSVRGGGFVRRFGRVELELAPYRGLKLGVGVGRGLAGGLVRGLRDFGGLRLRLRGLGDGGVVGIVAREDAGHRALDVAELALGLPEHGARGGVALAHAGLEGHGELDGVRVSALRVEFQRLSEHRAQLLARDGRDGHGLAVHAPAQRGGAQLVRHVRRRAREEGQPPARHAGVEHEAHGVDVRALVALAVPEELRGHVLELVRRPLAGRVLRALAQPGRAVGGDEYILRVYVPVPSREGRGLAADGARERYELLAAEGAYAPVQGPAGRVIRCHKQTLLAALTR